MRETNNKSGELAVGTWNVNGAERNIERIRDLQTRHNLDVLVLTETWLKPEKSMPLGFRHESFRLAPNECARGQGGVTILLGEDVEYKLLNKGGDAELQHVAVKIGEVTIVGLYVNPSVQGKTLYRLTDMLERIKALTPGRVCVLGDFNARHRKWDVAQNHRGTELNR